MNTDPSQEVQTSPTTTPLNNTSKKLSIVINAEGSLSVDIDGSWPLHEAIGALVLTSLNLYTNNTQSPGINYLASLIQNLTVNNDG
ncbi:hypothetical protein [uncultured Flavobacterium sp.]|uniref:hypothetical protein n=1 Tax=uncultured Flavobacterium sp. TaxID=165435 RepID=UPI00259843EC|nr:hypothetical protein [uncultured Flavobacterium sp.]